MDRTDIASLEPGELSQLFKEQGLKPFRARQVFEWISRGVENFDEMTNLPKALREELSSKYFFPAVHIKKKFVSSVDGTVKYLFELYDGRLIESVVMKYHHGYSQCLSTQAGCRMNCSFCATGKGGFERNLLPSEMLGQIQCAQRDLEVRISNVVLMGMGEPLDNYDNTVKFLKLVTNEKGLNLGARHISLSTCGLVDRIYDLMKLDLQITLSVSLHAPLDGIRSDLMPINKKWGVESLMEACKKYTEHTGRRISFEYIIIDGVNNTEECLLALKRYLSGMIAHINLIPANPVKGSDSRGTRQAAERFKDQLLKNGLNATVRRTLGADIDASCGQLKAEQTD